jgi:type II secretory pathway component PulK
MGKKGVVLLLVVGVVFVVLILAAVVLSTMDQLSRQTHHRASRIQAYYAALAGMNYGYEMLRTGAWSIPSNVNWNDPSFPHVLVGRNVNIAVVTPANCPAGTAPPPGTLACISVTVDYTYTP